MRCALRLAKKAWGQTSPNPMVGAVLVQQDRVIGQGWHRRAGDVHAEVAAIRDAMARGENLSGSTLYVTLEPCSTQGRTPPCTRAILEAGIRRVVVAATDPNPNHAGRGLVLLRESGVDVTSDIEGSASEELNETFNHWIVKRTPFLALKLAMTLDGKIATASGKSQWITGERARRETHRLRQRYDAILVGVGTVLADNPSLTLRDARDRVIGCKPRLILDTQARTPLDSRVLIDEYRKCTLVCVGENADEQRVKALKDRVDVLTVPVMEQAGGLRLDLGALPALLADHDITSVFAEGGGTVAAALLDAHWVHRTYFFYAPLVLGGREAIRSVGGPGWNDLVHVPKLVGIRKRQLGPDLLVSGQIAGG
jgi:diaminohydroxyphosphoribosylaminopyrimidine deaminase/5-amino-6-(5-phosphoribosylamino)uracil reductase